MIKLKSISELTERYNRLIRTFEHPITKENMDLFNDIEINDKQKTLTDS